MADRAGSLIEARSSRTRRGCRRHGDRCHQGPRLDRCGDGLPLSVKSGLVERGEIDRHRIDVPVRQGQKFLDNGRHRPSRRAMQRRVAGTQISVKTFLVPRHGSEREPCQCGGLPSVDPAACQIIVLAAGFGT